MSNNHLEDVKSQRKRVSNKTLISAGLTLAEAAWLTANGASTEDYVFWAVLVLVKIGVSRWAK